MNPTDPFKINITGRLSARLLSDYEESLMKSLIDFASRLKLPEIVPTFCKCLEVNIRMQLSYILIRPVCGAGNDLPGFVDMSAFDNHFPGSGFDLRVHDDGLEIFAVLTDRNNRKGRINIGLNASSLTRDELHQEIRKLSEVLVKETGKREVESPAKKDKSLATLIHQIRNPLATILISASQMAAKSDDKYDEDDRMLIDFINSESERIEYFLSRYSKYVNAGRVELKETESAVLLEILQEISSGRKINSFFTVSDSLADTRLMIDTDQIREAFNQVMENSMESGASKIQITLKREGSYIKVIFSDDGPGIRPEMLRMVKEPFYSTKDGGSGLGIPIAEKIVNAHDGNFCFEQTEVPGFTVIFSLPADNL